MKNKGFSFIEIIIALSLFLILTLLIFNIILKGIKLEKESSQSLKASSMASLKMEELISLPLSNLSNGKEIKENLEITWEIIPDGNLKKIVVIVKWQTKTLKLETMR